MSKKAWKVDFGGGKSKMADYFDDESDSLLPRMRKCPKRNTEFKKDEILQRANLFKDEYNQDGIHDRILVLQVMPNDYEMRELTARLERNEITVVSEVKSKVDVETRNESAKKMPNATFSSDRLIEDTGEDFILSAHVADDEQPYSNTDKDEVSPPAELSSSPEICETFVRSPSNARAFVSQGDTDEFQTDTRSGFYFNESKTERSSVSQNSAFAERYYSASQVDIPSRDGVKASDCSVEVKSKNDTDDSEVYSSLPEKPTPRLRRFFPNASREFPENKMGLNVYDCAIESGSTKGESEFSYSEKTELGSAECVGATGFDARNGIQLSESAVDEPTDSASASDVQVLREHRIYVHAGWLAVNSDYFRSMLYESGMRECTSAEFSMKVTEFEEEAFLFLLRSIYDPDVLDTVEIGQLLNVLRLSVKYEVRFSTVKARRVLEAMPLTLNVSEAILEAVNSGGLPDLGKVMKNVEVQLLGEFEPLDETWESEKFATLSEDALRFILGSDRLIVQSENTVFIALMQWIAKNAELYGDITEYSDLINLVRFELMKPTYIKDVVHKHEIATQLDDFSEIYLNAITYHALPLKRRKQVKQREWCDQKDPTFMWILYPEPEMFTFDEKDSDNSSQSSSFWFWGYKMHLQLDLSTSQDETCLYLVVENLVEDGSIELVYNVDVKFGAGLHKTFTCDSFVYRRNDLAPPPGNYPFDESYSLGEIKEFLLGSSIKVPITFEITLEKILND